MDVRFKLVLSAILIVLFSEYSFCQNIEYETMHLSTPRKGIASVVADDLIYFVGGLEYNEYSASKIIDIYDTITGNWTTTTLSGARSYITTLVVDPNIYFIGGSDWINSPYIYSTTLQDFVLLANTSSPTVRAPIQITHLNSTLVVVGQFSIDFLDLDTREWNYSPELTSLVVKYPSANVIVAEEVVIVISPVQSTSAWTYNVKTKNLTEHKNVLEGISSPLVKFEGTNGVVFMVFNDKCLLYNVAEMDWRLYKVSNIQHVTHIGEYSYILGDTIYVDNWNGSAAMTLTQPFTYASSFGPYILLYDLNVFKLYTKALQYYGSIPYTTTSTTFTLGTTWSNENFIFRDNAIIVTLNAAGLNTTSIGPFAPPVSSIFIYDDNTALLLQVDAGSPFLLTYKYDGGPSVRNPAFTPQYLVGDQMISLEQSFKLLSPSNAVNFSIQFPSTALVSQKGNSVIAMLPTPTHIFYKAMDIYNYRTGEWTNGTHVPEELFQTASANADTQVPINFMPSAIVQDEIYLWNLNTFAVYNVTLQQWTTVNTTDVTIYPFYGQGKIFTPEPVINDVVYLYTLPGRSFYKVANSKDLVWTQTSEAFDSSQYYFSQRIVYSGKIYALRYDKQSTKHDAIFNYNPAVDTWDLTYLPTPVLYASMVIGGDFLLVFTVNSTIFYLSMPTGQWVTIDNFDYNYLPATRVTTNSSLIIAGGVDPLTLLSTDLVLIFDISSFVLPPVAPNQTDSPSDQSANIIEGPIIAAIVVPIVVVVGVGAAVLIVLIRRRDKKRKNNVSMVGLEAKFGEWFTPFSDIQFEEQLGQGANGQVFKGRWRNTQVALKVSMTQAHTSVVSELSLMINMRPHPNIVQLLGFSVHPETNSIILILEFCNGGSLDNTLFDEKNRDTLTLEQKITWLKDIARGISHLHSNKIVHRDIAARNILLHNNEAKVTDFGMSRLVDEQQQRGTTKSELGPIRWMAPEALRSKEYSTKSDVWSFGILMFEVIAQQEPHPHEDPITIGRQIRDEGKTPEIPATCPPPLIAIMQHCWKLNPDDRPSFDKLLQLMDVI